MASPRLIVVIGATGTQGGSVVSALLENPSYRIRGVTRNASSEKAKALSAKGVEVVTADVNDIESLKKAFQVRTLSHRIHRLRLTEKTGRARNLRQHKLRGDIHEDRRRVSDADRIPAWKEPRRRSSIFHLNPITLHLEHPPLPIHHLGGQIHRPTLRIQGANRRLHHRFTPRTRQEDDVPVDRVLWHESDGRAHVCSVQDPVCGEVCDLISCSGRYADCIGWSGGSKHRALRRLYPLPTAPDATGEIRVSTNRDSRFRRDVENALESHGDGGRVCARQSGQLQSIVAWSWGRVGSDVEVLGLREGERVDEGW